MHDDELIRLSHIATWCSKHPRPDDRSALWTVYHVLRYEGIEIYNQASEDRARTMGCPLCLMHEIRDRDEAYHHTGRDPWATSTKH